MGLFDWLKKKNVSEQLQVVQATKKTNTETIEKVVNSDDHTLLDDLIVSAFPSSNGLYPHEILMLSYVLVGMQLVKLKMKMIYIL